MSNKEYSKEQLELLKGNIYVKVYSPKYITFTDELKIEALKLDDKGVYFRDIFRYFGFPDFIIDSEVPKQALKNWRRIMKAKGLTGLVGTKKGRKRGEKIDFESMSLKEQNEYLHAENAYLKELHKKIYGHYP